MAKTIANVETTQTFSAWLDKTNELAGAFANVLSVDAESYPTGTAGVNGAFEANTLTVTTGLLTANASANIVGSANVSVAVNVGANVTANTSAIKVGNSTVNAIITSTSVSIGSNVVANTSALFVGNNSVNSIITSNTASLGNTTIAGFANISSTLAAGDTTITGFANVSGTANVGGATNLRSTLTVNGAVTIANTLSSGNTSTTNLSVTGFANVSGTANVGGATNLRGTLTVNGAVTIANSVASGNNNLTGYINVSSTANVGGATNLRSTLAVNGAVTISNTLSSGNTTVNNLTISGTINRSPVITLDGDLTGSVTLTDLQNGTLTATIAADSVALGTDTTGNYVASISVANGVSGTATGEGSTPTLRVVPNNGIVANSTGVFAKEANGISVDSSGINVTAGQGIVANSSGVFAKAANGISVDASGINVQTGTGLFANTTALYVNTTTIAVTSSPTFTGTSSFANITLTGIINANGSIGLADQVLRTDGSGKVYWANPLLAGDTGYIEDITAGSGLSESGTTKNPTIAVVANNGITANSTGVFVRANNGLIANTSGLFVRSNTGLTSNSSGLFVNSSYIATITANNASYLGGQLPAYYTNATNISTGTLAVERGGTGVTTANGTGSVIRQSDAVFLANTTIAKLVANGALGTTGQHLAANSTGGVYWETPAAGDITAVTAGNGITGGGTSGDVTITVNAQTGLLANSSGLYVNASSVSIGTLPVARGGTGATTFTSGALLRGNGTSAVSAASAADIVAAIGTTRVANATYADTAGSVANATRATASNTSLVSNDNASSGTFYPVWVDSTSGDLAIKISSTKLTFNPSTGVLSATSFSGSGASLTSLDAGNISAGTLPVARGGTGVTTSTGTGSTVLSASPTFTGTPAGPTAAVDTNTTQLATTAYVVAQGYLKSATASSTYLPLTGGTISGNVVISGNLTINGITTTINSTTISVDDKNIELGNTASPSDASADGGGITLKGTSDKTFNWVDATDAWTSSEHLNLLTGKAYYINGTSVLSSTTLGSGVTGSSLTSVGTIGTGVWQGTAVGVLYGGTGATSASGARTNLGATTVGGNLFTLTNPSAVTFPRFNADNTVSALSASDFRTAIGAGTSSTTGTVTSVASGNGITGGTITSTGTLSIVANNGLVANTSGLFVQANSGLLANSTGLFVNASSVSVGTLPVARGGTGATTFTSGALLKGNGTSAVSAASAADIVAAISTTPVAVANTIDNQNSSSNLSMWTGTQAQYDAIGTKDSNTLYFVSA